MRSRARRRPLLLSPVVVLAGLGVLACAGVVVAAPLLACVFAVATAAGSWLSPRALQRFLPPLAAAAVVSVVVGDGDAVVASTPLLAFAAVGVLGFGVLPRGLLARAVRAARVREQARADAEILALVDDARLFRRLGRSGGDERLPQEARPGRASSKTAVKDVACALAQRDRLYRLLRLAERAIADTAVVALYVVDDAGSGLRLVEQLAAVDAQNQPRLSLAGRGVGEAGLVGLCVNRRAPVRVVDVDGPALRAHRLSGPPPQSALCVPVLARDGGVRAVLVVDRCEPRAFVDDDEAFALALGAELLEGLHTEQLIVDLEAERRRGARVYGAARALAGVTRTAEVVDVALEAVQGLSASVAIIDVVGHMISSSPGCGEATVLRSSGALASLRSGPLDPDSFAARSLAELCTLPHTQLAAAAARPLCHPSDGVDVGALRDLRVVPLLLRGQARGLLVLGSTEGRFSPEVVDALEALADVVALALASSRAFDAIERQATTDGLTGLLNRRSFDARLDEAVARARRSGRPLCVLMSDVDHFKSVNDAWGHATGDEVLKGVARGLSAAARTTDVVARLGGEEFVVLCEGTDVNGAVVVAERMRQGLKSLTFQTAKGPLSVTASFGVALLQSADTGCQMLERADQQLGLAKLRGRDRVVS